MIVAHASDATLITGIVAVFFLLLALIAFARAITKRYPPNTRSFRVGVFIERDHLNLDDDDVDDDEEETLVKRRRPGDEQEP